MTFLLFLLGTVFPIFYINLYKFETPWKFIIINLIAGSFSVLLLLFIKSFLFPETINLPNKETLTITLFISFIEAGLLEEFVKNLFFLISVYFTNKYFDFKNNKFLYLVSGASIGLAFAIIENGFYALNPETSNFNNIFGRLFTTIPAHIIMNIIFAFLYSKKFNLLICFLASILFHAIYDFFALPSNLLGDLLLRILLICGFGLIVFMGKNLRESSTKQKELI